MFLHPSSSYVFAIALAAIACCSEAFVHASVPLVSTARSSRLSVSSEGRCIGFESSRCRSQPHIGGYTCVKCGATVADSLNQALARRVWGGRERAVVALAAGGEDSMGQVTAVGHDLDRKTVEELWSRPKKHLLSVGKAGVKPSHVRSLADLVASHNLVKVKINIPGCDLDKVGVELCKEAAADSEVEAEESTPSAVSVVMNRPNQNVILFAKTAFLDSLEKGEVFNG